MAGDLIQRCLSIRDLKTGLCYNLTKSALYILAMTIYSIMNSTCVIVRGSVATKLATPMIFIMSQPYGSMEHASSHAVMLVYTVVFRYVLNGSIEHACMVPGVGGGLEVRGGGARIRSSIVHT